MRLKKLLDRRAGYSLASLGLLLSLAAPAVIPAFASAATLSQRSITMSTSAVNATGVSYNLKFTGTTAIGATEDNEGGIIIDFCSNSSVIEDANGCDAPTGMDTSGVSVSDVKYNNIAAGSNGSVSGSGNHIEWVAGSAYAGGGATFEMTLSGIDNPSTVGVFYARITTYTDEDGHLDSYVDAEDVGNFGDEGSIALAATAGIGVTGYVYESMIFCVSGQEPSENCGSGVVGCPDAEGCVTSPSMVLGEETFEESGIFALTSSALSTGSVWAQLSSNAVGNTVVNLKSDATSCGGLYRNGNPANCNIGPQNQFDDNQTIAAGQALFGLTVADATPAPDSEGDPGSGSGTIARAGNYDATKYFIDYADGNNTGVTSTYGSPLFNTTGAVDNMNTQVTFGASVTNNTPAGTYGATLSMIAVGTF